MIKREGLSSYAAVYDQAVAAEVHDRADATGKLDAVDDRVVKIKVGADHQAGADQVANRLMMDDAAVRVVRHALLLDRVLVKNDDRR